jgi:antitoxin MazE
MFSTSQKGRKSMRIPLIKIGNSKGIRIPSALIKKCGFSQEVDIDIKNQTLVLSLPKEGREKWKTALQNEKEKNPFTNNEEEWL